MKKLMFTTALVAVTSFGAIAQTSPETAAPAHGQVAETAVANVQPFLATEFIGKNLYALDSEAARALHAQADMTQSDPAQVNDNQSLRWTSTSAFAAERDDWRNIGSISDIVMTQDGEILGVLADVGGFLGLLSRTVMIDINDLYFVADDSNSGDEADFHVVAPVSREQLESMPEYQG